MTRRPVPYAAPENGEEAIQLLRARLEESGLSSTQFAKRCLMREPRTVRRWLAGDSPLPNLIVDWLVKPLPSPWPEYHDE